MAGVRALPDLVSHLVVNTSGLAKAEAEAKASGARIGTSMAMVGAAIGVAVVGAAAGIGIASVKMAKDFETSMAHVVNDAGESRKALAMVSAEVLKMAGEVGVAPLKLADALYFVESAGFHGAAALNVLRVSAIAAKVSGADMTAVADITTSALNAYGMAADQAAHVTDVMLQAVSEGKMKFQDLAVAMPTVLPTAAALHVGLDEVGAAIATMTMQGDHASDAATHLRMMMLMLVAPTSMSAKAMQEMGLNASDAQKQAMNAATGLKSIHLTASELSASMTTGGPHALLNTLKLLNDRLNLAFPNANDPRREAILKQILSLKGMQAALELTGTHISQFTSNEQGMADASTGVGKTMAGWQDIQGQLNTKLDQFKGKIDAFMISLGNALLPLAVSAVDFLGRAFDGLNQVLDGVGASKTTEENLNLVGGRTKEAAAAMGDGPDGMTTAITNLTGGIKDFMDSKSTKDFVKLWDDVATALERVGAALNILHKGWDLSPFGGVIDTATAAAKSLSEGGSGTVSLPHGPGKRAAGGPVLPNSIYTVGEQGPETLVMGSRGGTVIPYGGSGQGAASRVIHLRIDSPIVLDGREVGRFVKEQIVKDLAGLA